MAPPACSVAATVAIVAGALPASGNASAAGDNRGEESMVSSSAISSSQASTASGSSGI